MLWTVLNVVCSLPDRYVMSVCALMSWFPVSTCITRIWFLPLIALRISVCSFVCLCWTVRWFWPLPASPSPKPTSLFGKERYNEQIACVKSLLYLLYLLWSKLPLPIPQSVWQYLIALLFTYSANVEQRWGWSVACPHRARMNSHHDGQRDSFKITMLMYWKGYLYISHCW